MVLNSYAMLDGFLCVLRLALGTGVVGLGVQLVRRRSIRAAADEAAEDWSYLLYLLAGVLVVLNLLSWPLFYLLLQSYVPEWEGVMCIYGVTRIGVGSVGPSRFLPDLLAALQAGKPAVVFAAGAWAVLYAVNRPTRTAPLASRVRLAAVFMGLLSVADALAEGAYLVIPKKDEVPSAGCCTAPPPGRDEPADILGEWPLSALSNTDLYILFYGVGCALYLGLAVGRRTAGRHPGGPGLTVFALGALASLAVGGAFLIEVAAPTILRRPGHHCAYDLITEAPGAVAAVALYVLASFAVGWAWVAGRFGACAEAEPFAGVQVRRLLAAALVGYAAALVLVSAQLLLACAHDTGVTPQAVG